MPLRWCFLIEYSLSFIFGFCETKYFKIFILISTGKNVHVWSPFPEEIPPATAKRAKKVDTPSKSSTSPPKRARTPTIPKSPSPRKRGNAVRGAEPIQLEGPEIGPPEEHISPVNYLPSLIALENAHLHATNQLALVKMRQLIAPGRGLNQ